jgi:hypothetical protein
MLTAEQTRADGLQTMLDAANDMVTTLTTDLETANARLAKLDSDEAKAQALMNSNMAKGFLASMVTQNATALTVTATHKGGDVTVLVNPAGDPAMSDFGVSEKDPAPDAAGFTKVTVEKEADSDSFELAVVYTDVQADGPKLLLANEGAGMNSFFTVAEADFDKKAMSSSFPSAPASGSTTVLLGNTVAVPGSANSQLQFAGMWRGVSGTYICDACTDTQKLSVSATLNDKGEMERTFALGAQIWVFQPTDPKAMVDVPDADYLWFGWWHDVPTKEEGDGTHMFRTFAGGSQPYDTDASGSQIQVLEGNATYSGSAAGKYAQQGGLLLAPMFFADAFTATATLTAKFGTDTEDGTIEGSITSFENSAGEAMEGWKVTLEAIDLETDAANFDGGMAEAAIDTATSDTGSWSGDFFGNGRDDGEPGAVAGEFEADFGVVGSVHTSIAGAYGAHNTSADE